MIRTVLTGCTGAMLLWLQACGGGAETRQQEFKLSVDVTHERYKPIHSGVEREVTPEVVKTKVLALAGDNNVLRSEAMADLVAFGRREPRSMGLITQAIDHPDPKVREACLIVMGKVGPGSWSVPTDKLRSLINDPDDRVKAAVLFAVGSLGINDSDIRERAFEYLSHYNPVVRTHAAECLRELKYWPAIPALIYHHLAKENLPIEARVYAWEALQNITLEHVQDDPRSMDMFAILNARARAWTDWWEANRYRYGG